jgi:class 3 adenylate cyclase
VNESGHTLLLRFDTDDAQFARGFELGRLWSMLRDRPDEPVTALAHVSSAEMLIRMGEATGRVVVGEFHDDTWVTATFTEASALESDPCR